MIIREVMMLSSYTNVLEKGVFFWPQPKVISWVQFSGPKTGQCQGARWQFQDPSCTVRSKSSCQYYIMHMKRVQEAWWQGHSSHLYSHPASSSWFHPFLVASWTSASLECSVASPRLRPLCCKCSPSLFSLLAMKHQPVFHLPVKANCLARKFIAFFIKNLHTGKIKSDLQSNELFCNLMKWCDLPRDLVQRVLCANLVLGTQEDFRDTNFSWVPCPPLKLQGYN